MANGGLVNCAMQQQQLQALAGPHQSGSNLQLTTGAMCHAAGNAWDGQEELNSLQQMHLLQLDGAWPGDSGYFDLYKSGSSLDSLKAEEGGGFSSSSCPTKMSSCGSTDARPSSTSTAAHAAAVSHQQDQLLSMYQQGRLPQVEQLGPAGDANSLFGRPSGPNMRPQGYGNPASLMSVNNGLMVGSQEMPGAGAGLPLSNNGNGKCVGKSGGQDITEEEVSATPQAVSAVVEHIPSITAMTGAVVVLGSNPSGQLSFKLLGTASQVQMAQGVIQLLLAKQQQQQCDR
jgi:hypothetical protein